MNRRAFIGVFGAGVATGLAGCSALGDDSQRVDGERRIDLADSDLTASEFRAAAAGSHETFGSRGVWGTAEAEPNHEVSFQGAWTGTLDHADETSSTHLLGMFGLPDAPDGTPASQVWLWSGVEPAADSRARRIETGLSLPSDADALGIYSPAQDYDAETSAEYTVESGRLDVATLRTTMPLAAGTIGVDPKTRIGDGGAYAPYWEGESDTPQSIAATTEVRWASGKTRELDWEFGVSTTV
ncbi:hypothetical protein HWV07_08495 [Natronomonas salina]|uniref:hypothetical protein n=1 Tax=Natronomonas salina TaxID=1710540 RepID=UPI0015B5233A|nr:hypothetical protein [Natronomonas salina]QLD89066.1 hypothetical protein HWV07_08495 [Natronomonas salina]